MHSGDWGLWGCSGVWLQKRIFKSNHLDLFSLDTFVDYCHSALEQVKQVQAHTLIQSIIHLRKLCLLTMYFMNTFECWVKMFCSPSDRLHYCHTFHESCWLLLWWVKKKSGVNQSRALFFRATEYSLWEREPENVMHRNRNNKPLTDVNWMGHSDVKPIHAVLVPSSLLGLCCINFCQH